MNHLPLHAVKRGRKLTYYIDKQIPPSLKHHDVDLLRKTRLVIGFSWLASFWCIIFALLFFTVFHTRIAGTSFLVLSGLTLIIPKILYRTQSPTLAANILLGGCFLTLAFTSFFLGGFNAPGLVWNVSLPVVAFMMADKIWGVFWTTVVFFEFLTFYTLKLNGLPQKHILADSELLVLRGVSVIGLLMLLVLITVLYETFKDRTLEKLHQINASLTEARDKALEASRAKATFLANMSHELRTPLNAVIGYSDMLLEEGEFLSSKEIESDLKRIREAGKYLLRLVNDILDLSKIEAGKMEVELQEFDIKELIEDLRATFKPILFKNKNTLEIDCPDQIGKMRSDPIKVKQCLYNLMSNACKFTHQGRIFLKVKRTNSQPEQISFQVSDTGIGMSPEVQKKVFAPFVQADSSMARKYGGTGLGLALCNHFCRLLGGEILLQSEEGKGSTFTINLPAEAVLQEKEETPALPEEV